ncbi:hypothetical protein BJ944DRAFT_267992 [Cunninghamella echinulata]|nr:hypothetical protein BJ944DRAFT_267992 [Cunninghamella echinulata]
MGIFTEEIQKTSVTLYIEKLSNYEEIEWYQFQQLIESMNMQQSGPREAIEAIRKRLKHGTEEQKLRVLEVLKLLMENSPQQFRQQLCNNEKMRERFEMMLSSTFESVEVKKKLLSLLGAWIEKYKGESGIRALASIYDSGLARLGKTRRVRSSSSAQPNESQPSETSSSTVHEESKRRSLPPPAKPKRPETNIVTTMTATSSKKTKPRSYSNSEGRAGSSNPTFNFATAKPKIIQEIAVANQHANQLHNALKLLNTNEDRWEVELQHDKRIQEYREQCEESRKKIVKYTRLVEDEEWIGTLLSTNEELLKILDMYDIMLVGEIPVQLSSPHSYQQENVSSTPTSPIRQITYPTNETMTAPSTTSNLHHDLAGLQLVPKPTSNHHDDNGNDDEDPFADPFADPVDEYDDPHRKRRENEYVL